MSSDILLKSQEETAGCLTLTLNRGAQRNCLSRAMLAELHAAVDDAAEDSKVKVVVIRGDGPAFCAGHDLKELTSHRSDGDSGAAFYRDTMRECSDLMMKIVRCPKPVIARVHGIATAAGCQLVASCDLAVAADTARFATPGVNIGLFCSTPMVALGRNLARKHAMEMLLLGEFVAAQRAAEMGLVNRVVPEQELDAAIGEYVARLVTKPPYTMSVGIEGFYRQLDMDLSAAYDYVSEIMVTNMLADDAKEGIGAFLEKRKPVWPEK